MFFKELGTVGVAFNNTTLSDVVTENVVWLSYAGKIMEKLNGGLSLKFLYQSYTQDIYTRTDPVFDYGKRDSLLKLSLDLGFLYNLYPKVYWGVAFTDLNRPNVALNPTDKELLPIGVKNGIAYRDKRISAVVDFIYRDDLYKVNAGAERWFKNRTYALRGGGGLGSREYKNFTFGMSANWGNFEIDYAFLYPISGIKETYGNHKISFVYRFGKAPIDELETGSLELYYSKLQAEAEMLRARLEKAEDERSRMEKLLVEEALSRLKEKARA